MARPKGYAKTGGGSRKGVPNKTTADIKEMILAALNKAGGEEYLTRQAHENLVAFLGLLGKILPMQVSGSGNVLLIEQLCVAANASWQRERAALANGTTIEGDAAEVSDDPDKRVH